MVEFLLHFLNLILGKLHINDSTKIIFLNLKKITGTQKCRSFGTAIFLGNLLSMQSHWLFMESYFSDDKSSVVCQGCVAGKLW